MHSMFRTQPEIPPVLLVIVVVGVFLWFIPPALHLGPLGLVVCGAIALALAFSMAERVKIGQAERRAEAGRPDVA